MLLGMHKEHGATIFLGILGILSLPMALAGQYLLDQTFHGRSGWLLIGSAALFFVSAFSPIPGNPIKKRIAVQGKQTGQKQSKLPEGTVQPVQKGRDVPASQEIQPAVFHDNGRLVCLALVGAVLNLSSLFFFGGNRLTWYGVLCWQGGLFLFLGGIIGFDVIKNSVVVWFCRLKSFQLSAPVFILGLITLAGAVYRLVEIESLPAEPGVDLPLVLMSVQKVLKGEWPIFFTYHPGREGLYMYLAAGFLRIVGATFPALRTAGALIGTVTIPVVYWLGRKLFNNEVGLLAAALFAMNRWHIILSRTGLRFILMPLFCLLLVIALTHALETRKPFHWAILGLVLGWGFYTYNAWLIMPAVVVGGLGLERLVKRNGQFSDIYLLIFAILVACMVFVPEARFAYDDPNMFSLRVVSRLAGSESSLPGHLGKVLWTNLVRTLGMLNITGDSVANINVPLKRQLGLVSAAFFPLGLFFLFSHLKKNVILVLTLLITCLPTMLSIAFPAEVPNAGRASGLIGFVCIVAALPLSIWRRSLSNGITINLRKHRFRLGLGLACLCVLAVLGAEGNETRIDYFQKYRKSLTGGNYSISGQIVQLVKEHGHDLDVYLVAYPHFYDGNALRTQMQIAGIAWDNELVETSIDVDELASSNHPLMIILHPDDSESLKLITEKWPASAYLTYYDNNGDPVLIGVICEE